MERKQKEEMVREYFEDHFKRHGIRLSATLHRPAQKACEVTGLPYGDVIKIMSQIIKEKVDEVMTQIGDGPKKA